MKNFKEIRRKIGLTVAAGVIAFGGMSGAEKAGAQDGGDEEPLPDAAHAQVVPEESLGRPSNIAVIEDPGEVPPVEETINWSVAEAIETGNLEVPLSPELQKYYEERVAVSSPYLIAQIPGTDILYDVADIQPQLLELRSEFSQQLPDVPLNRPVGFQIVVSTENEKEAYRKNILPLFRRGAIENQTGTQVFNTQTHSWESLNISENSVPSTIVVFHPVANMEQALAEMGVGDRQHIVSSKRTKDIHMLKAIDNGILKIHMFVGNFDFGGSFPQILMAATRTAWSGSPEIDPFFEPNTYFDLMDTNLSNFEYPFILSTESICWGASHPEAEAFRDAHPPLN